MPDPILDLGGLSISLLGSSGMLPGLCGACATAIHYIRQGVLCYIVLCVFLGSVRLRGASEAAGPPVHPLIPVDNMHLEANLLCPD